MPSDTSPAPALSDNPMLGIGLRIAAVISFLTMTALVKSTQNIPIGELLFFRSFFAIFPLAAILLYRGELIQSLKTRHLPSHFMRAILSISAIALTFLAVLNLPLPDATAISYATPLIIVVLSALIYKEHVRLFRGTAVLLGFVGVMIIIWPNLSFADGSFSTQGGRTLGIIYALSAAIMASFGQVTVRKLVRLDNSSTIVLIFSIIASCMALLTLPFGWVWPNVYQFALLVGVGVLGGAAQIFMTESFRHADMSVVAPFDYSSLILSILIGYFIFAEVPTLYTLVGGLVVTSAGIAIILRERHLGLERAAARKSATPHA